jgi:D-3-phosphoglycerate dehydrogenase
VAALLAPFEVRLLGHDIAQVPDFAGDLVPLDELLADADVVTLHVSGAGQVIGRRELELMKPGAVLVNAARGGLVDEAALHQALSEDRLAGAYLDVFEKEPYEGPLAQLPNILLTPHAGSYAREARALMEHEAVRNLLERLS